MKQLQSIAACSIFLSFAAAAAEPELILSEELLAKQESGLYIVQMSELPAIAYEGQRSGYQATKPAKGKKLNPNSAHVKRYVERLAADHGDALQSVGAAGRKIYDYRYSFNGFAAKLTSAQVEALKARGDVVQVWENEYRQPNTNTSPDFIGLTGGGEPWSKGYAGEDIIIGMIDTGIWPEHPSFADVPTPKKGNKGPLIPYGSPPAHWQGTACEFGNVAFNPNDAAFECNDKLLGAAYYHAAFDPSVICGGGLDCGWTEFLSARDNDGHGSHTSATAGGNYGVEASIGGDFLGTVSGMAPRARIASYKVCWNGSLPTTIPRGCGTMDSMAAIDQAVVDGVDVINFSIGSAATNFNGPEDIAFLFAAGAGVWVATSAGNTGPDAQTIGTPSGVPWITAVAAAQDDQVFGVGVEISTSAAGVSGIYEGVEAAISVPLTTTGPVSGDLVIADPLNGCGPLANAGDVNGQVALIIRGVCTFSDKFLNAQAAGATALIVFDNVGDPIVMGGSSAGIVIPGVMVSRTDGELLFDTITGGDDVFATLDPAITVPKENTIATFSSRGPNGGAPDIIKPDVAAPGVAILAAETPDGNDFQVQGELFQSISGTSMASPHVAGLFALLKQAHPDWSPAVARSAIMTTARQNLNKSFGDTPADPFDIGAGHIVPGDAFDPGLAYEADLLDYARFTCGSETQPPIFTPGTCAAIGSIDSSDLNLASIGIGDLVGSQTVTRTVTSVANNSGNRTYTVSVDEPPGTNVTVSPSSVTLKPGQSATYQVTITANSEAIAGQWSFGSLTWAQGKYSIRSPIAVRPVALSAPAEISVAAADANGSTSYDVQIGYSGNFAATGHGLEAAEVQPGNVGIGGATLHFVNIPVGTRYARFSLFDESVGDGTGADDLDLQVQGPGPGFPFVAFSGTPTSEEEINLVDPIPGQYAVFVIHFDSVNPVTPYQLHFWDVGPDLGNMTVTAPATVSVGTTETIDIDWVGLAPATKYRGAVTYSNDDGELGLTVIGIDTN